jgi:hypothetical protein
MSGTANITFTAFSTGSGDWLNQEFPGFAASASGLVGTVGAADLDFPAFTASLSGGVDVLDAEFGGFTLSANGLTGEVGVATASFSGFSVTASGVREGIADLVWAGFTLSASGSDTTPAEATITFPAFTVDAYGAGDSLASTENYQVWTVNTDTKAHATYTQWLADSYALFNGKHIAAFSDGIYELTGTADGAVAIPWKLTWAPTDAGTTKQKRVDAAFVNLRQSGDFKLRVLTDEKEERIYGQTMTGFPAGMHPKRVSLTRYLEGRNWQFGVENSGTSDAAIDEIEIDVVVGKRKLR